MIILGFDPGFAIVGYGVIEKDNKGVVKPIDYGVINTPKDESMAVRLSIIYDQICVLIEKFKPDAIAIEELFFNTNTKTAINVAQARGVIVVCSNKFCGSLYEYTPLQIKQAITGNGRAEKQQIQYMVKMMLGLKAVPKPDDAADALAVALTHAQTNDLSNQNML
ncbi:MAG TPA: crossover junction endodeoxyribonuclease RuvC [Clostridia bacterium]